MRVCIYRNLHFRNRVVWSETATKNGTQRGKLIGYRDAAEHVVLRKVEFVTLPKRCEAIRAALPAKQREVCAWVVGDKVSGHPPKGKFVQVSFDPYRGDFFFRCDTGEPVLSARWVWFTDKCWAVL